MEHELLQKASERLSTKAEEHEEFEQYCVFGCVSAADFIHREATRVCVHAYKKDTEGQREHLIDVVAFAMLMWDYIKGGGL